MNLKRIVGRSALCLLGLTLFASPVAAQVFNSGPSDPTLFDNVINVPPAPDIDFFQNLGGDGLTTQLNVFADGAVGSSFSANSGTEVNISGGFVNNFFNANSGSEVNISGGTVGDGFEAFAGSAVSISGGTVGVNFQAFLGSDVELIGGEFQLNGAPFSGSTVPLSIGDAFTGTLADGSTFIFSNRGEFADELSSISLTTTTLPALNLSPMTVSTADPSIPSGLRAGQTLTVQAGGQLGDNFEVVDATLNIAGGSIGPRAGAARSIVNVSDGSVDFGFEAHFGSVVSISGGSVGLFFNANSGSVVNISGGLVDERFNANVGSVVNISGGTIADEFTANSGSVVNISGGSVGRNFSPESGSDVELIGGEFQLNGSPFSGSSVPLSEGDAFTGTLADGSAFIFSGNGHFADDLSNISLTTTALPTLDLSPMIVSTANPSIPSGLRAGQTLTVESGGRLGDNFEVVDATLNIDGGGLGRYAGAVRSVVNINSGTVGRDFFAEAGSEINISGGSVSFSLTAFSGSTINITGGNVSRSFRALSGSEVNIDGGSVGDFFSAESGSEVNIDGGSVGLFNADSDVNINGGTFSDFAANVGSVVDITGGVFAERFLAFSGSDIEIRGSDFVLDGEPLDDNLTFGIPFTITNRDVTLSGVFADGSAFSFDLNSVTFAPDEDLFEPSATLAVTLISEFPQIMLGDCDLDGDVDFLDIPPFIAVLASNGFLAEADCNEDGVVTFLDIPPFIAILSAN